MPGSRTYSTFRVPLPTHKTKLDADFRIDIVSPRPGETGLRVSEVVDLESFKATCLPRPGQRDQDVLCNPVLWAAFTRMKLNGSISEHIHGLHTLRADLMPSSGAPPLALPACFPGCPHYELPRSVTARTRYRVLHDVLADILACQAVWYVRVLGEGLEVVDRLAVAQSADAQFWGLWKGARGVSHSYLDSLYIVSIRRAWSDSAQTWAYFPEVEIRGYI